MNNTTPPTTDSPELKPLQFSLRSMFGAMTALAVLLGLVMQFGWIGLTMFVISASILASIFKRNWWYALVVCGVVLLVALLMPRSTGHEPPSPRLVCMCNLKQIGLALHNYHDRYGSFPPAYIADVDGKPMHSWRVLLLPFMEESNLYEKYRFDEPWDGPNNRKLHKQVVSIYRCPSATNNEIATSYVAVVGPATAWPGRESTKFSDCSDGTSNTILIVEIANSGIHWMAPRDLSMSQMDLKINGKRTRAISSTHPRGACVLFVAGCIRFLPDDLPPETIKALLTIDGGEEVSPEDWE